MMSNTVKWIIRILAGLAVLFLVVALGALVFRYINGSAWQTGPLTLRADEGERGIPWSPMPEGHIPLRPDRWHSGGMVGRIFPFGTLLGLLFCLGFLILVGMGVAAVLAFTRLRKPAPALVTGVPFTPPIEPAVTAGLTHPCPNCQRPVNDDWNHCPYCGIALIPPDEPISAT
jgi:hypothetical protein